MRKMYLVAGLWAVIFCSANLAFGQIPRLVSRPFQGYSTTESVTVWMMFEGGVRANIRLMQDTELIKEEQIILKDHVIHQNYAPLVLTFDDLSPDTEYAVSVQIENVAEVEQFTIRTLPAEAPEEFSFLIGSCAYKGVGADKMLEPRKQTFGIYDAMRADSSDFMIWMGDNLYYLRGEWKSNRRMARKNIGVRLQPGLSAFLESRPQFATWDDHDFGPNNSDGTFKNKAATMAMFRRFWPLPAPQPAPHEGIYYTFSYGDVDFFMMDDRYNRIDQDHTQMWGKTQMEWLQQELKASRAAFKIIINGNQVLNETGTHEALQKYPELEELVDFLREDQVEGVLFLSGDRHFTELLKKEHPDMYPLYDLTCSPLTSWIRYAAGRDEEATNPLRVKDTQVIDWNYGKITISGKPNGRELQIEIKSEEGETFWKEKIKAETLTFPQK